MQSAFVFAFAWIRPCAFAYNLPLVQTSLDNFASDPSGVKYHRTALPMLYLYSKVIAQSTLDPLASYL